MSENSGAVFEPSRYLSKIGKADYLEVKWRLVWLRHEHPNAEIHTELYSMDDKHAVFSARVSIPDGGSATGWGSETAKDFGDFIEKAETKAIGRALAALGFGTQFSFDFEEGGSVADSPVAPKAPAKTDTTGDPATPAQVKLVTDKLAAIGVTGDLVSGYLVNLKKGDVSSLLKRIEAGEIESPDPHPDGRPASAVTQFWTYAKGVGLENMKDVDTFLGYNAAEAVGGDYAELLRRVKNKSTSEELEVPF